MEALKWLKSNKNESAFATNYFGETPEAIKFVKMLYKSGAVNVEIDNVYDEDWRIKREGGPYADALVIELPKPLNKKMGLMAEIYEHRPDEITASPHSCKKVDWAKDTKVYLWWD